jgi:transcriptional regulator with XRE-family HTH domain
MMIKQVDIPEIKRRLRRARMELGLSQGEVAELARISKSVIEKYESRLNLRIPNTPQLFKLSEVYGLSVDYLLGRTDVSGGATE